MRTYKIKILYFQEADAYVAEELENAVSQEEAMEQALWKFSQERCFDYVNNIECEEVKTCQPTNG